MLLAPILTRRLLGLQPIIMSDALGFYVQALCDAYSYDRDEQHLRTARHLLHEILQLTIGSPDLPAIGNTYDYPICDVVIPANTPCVYGTMQCGFAYLQFWQLTKDPDALSTLLAIRNSLQRLFRFASHRDNAVSISYTAIDNHTILNVSAITASYLFHLNEIEPDQEAYSLAHSLLRFVIYQQHENGSWPYSLSNPLVDNHHTGMLLQALAISLPRLDDDRTRARCWQALAKGVSYYLDHLYTKRGFPKISTHSTYPLDIGSVFEAVGAFHEILQLPGQLDGDMRERISTYWLHTILAGIRFLACRDGSFATRYYAHYPPFKMNIHSLRCGNAWALRSLALTLRWMSAIEACGDAND